MLKFNSWNVEYRPGGWIRAQDATGVTVFLRALPVGDGAARRYRVHMALMSSDEPITARKWRDVPFGDIELHVMAAASVSDEFRDSMDRPPEVEFTSLDALQDYFNRTHFEMSGMIAGDVLIDENAPGHMFRLVRPPDGRLTDEFLQNLADMYRWLVGTDRAPAPAIAESAGVPVRTVHRWVSEARKRGFLPPGIKGKAG